MGFSIWNLFKVRFCLDYPRLPHHVARYTFLQEDITRLRRALPNNSCPTLVLRWSVPFYDAANRFPRLTEPQLTKSLEQAGLLGSNAITILHRQRFLAKYGLDDVSNMGCDPREKPLQAQAISLLQAVQWLKTPIIFANVLTIVFEMLLGGA